MLNKILLDKIQNNDADLLTVDLSNQQLNLSDIRELVEKLTSNTVVKSINISGSHIENEGIELLSSPGMNFTTFIANECALTDVNSLISINRITELFLASNKIKLECIEKIAESKILTTLSLAGNNLKDEACFPLAKNKSLQKIILSHNKIDYKGAEAFAKFSSAKELDLSYNSFGDPGTIILSTNPHFKTLSLARNHISTSGIMALATQNKTLYELDISVNKVLDESSLALWLHPTLRKLNVSDNEISANGIPEPEVITRIETLIISNNLLGNLGLIKLAQVKSLIRLDASGNRISLEGTYACSLNKTLKSLTLSVNPLGDPGAFVLAQNNTIEELVLSYASIGDDGGIALAKNITLKRINLNYNVIGVKGKKALNENKHFDAVVISDEQPPEFTEDNLETIFKLSQAIFCICDRKGILQYFNPSLSRTLGYSHDELLTQSFFSLLHPLDKTTLEHQLNANNRVPFNSYENRYRCRDGSYRTIRWNSQLKHDRLYATGEDITEYNREYNERRSVEAKLISSQQHEMRAKVAEEYIQRQSEFISHLSHEIRNPLNGMFGLIDALKAEMLHVETVLKELTNKAAPGLQDKLNLSFSSINEFSRDMLTCAEYQKTILNDNLDLVKISEKKLILQNILFDLKKVFSELIAVFRQTALAKNIKIETDFPIGSTAWMKGDAFRLKQIIINLLSNAVKFTVDGTIKIAYQLNNLSEKQMQVSISVSDTGVGLTENEMTHLFQRFSQATSSTGSQYGGSGLGLHLARELAQAMGGDVTVTSIKSKGSIFSVILPFTIVSELELQTAFAKESINFPLSSSASIVSSKASSSLADIGTTIRPRRILVVEDNEINQKILTRHLKAAGHESPVVSNGKEALAAFNSASFDVILMDIQMPIMDGITATAEIRKREQELNLPRTPIFVVSGNALEEDKRKAFAAGVDKFITKPYNMKDINNQIKALPQRIELIKNVYAKPKLAISYAPTVGLLFYHKDNPINVKTSQVFRGLVR